MIFYRLRDIKTPPFAYVINKDEVVDACPSCSMPYQGLMDKMEVEVCTTEQSQWESRIEAKPLMADHWLIGDEALVAKFEAIMPGCFEAIEIEVASWLTRNPHALSFDPQAMFRAQNHSAPPRYFYLKPRHEISMSHELSHIFPPLSCNDCRREIPEIPIDWQPLPDEEAPFKAGSLKNLYLEGYDYLFREDVVPQLEKQFPNMILEALVSQPTTI
jgi:hypothetical protein